MAEYIVVKPWFGVKVNQRVELESPIHPALLPNIRPVGFATEGANLEQLAPTVELPEGTIEGSDGNEFVTRDGEFDWETVRDDIESELRDGNIDFDADQPAAELALLLDEEVREGIRLSAE